MGLFSKFHDTIFLKETNDLSERAENLKKLKGRVENQEELEKDLKRIAQGLKGENEIAFELKNANIGLYVIRDFTVEYQELKAQIDFFVVSPTNCYLIECKNLYGNVNITNTGEFQREINGKKEAIYSPYTQAQRHKDIIMKVWKEKHQGLFDNLFYEKTTNSYFQPLVVMANSNGILNTKYAPKEIKENTIRSDQLIARLKEDIAISKKKDDVLSSQKQMKEIAESWLKKNIENRKDYLSKYKLVDDNSKKRDTKVEKEKLQEELKKFRINRSKSMNVPAYYVFTNEQLEKLVEQKPQSLEQLKGILEPIKIKCHGKEIIEIIHKEPK